jgi:hypothetical protein
MKRIALVAALLGAIFAFAGNAMAAGGGSYTCTDSSKAGQTINSNVTVPAGANCDLSWSTVNGNVSVAGSLTTYGITTFNGNVSVTGGSFAAANWGVTINGNLSFTNPATYSYNGFWGNQGGTSNLVTGNLTYTITNAVAYPDYQSPLLYFGGGTRVNGSFNYTDQGTGFKGHLDQGGLTVGKTTTITVS